MNDADGQIIRLLTEMRDAQQDELAYRRQVMEESLALARRGVKTQRVALLVVIMVGVVCFATLVAVNMSGRQ